MTVSYQYDVASSSTGGFFRLLWRWRGSIWKLLYKELLLFIGIYLTIALSYDFLMAEYYKRYYERIVIFCSAFVEIIPLSFILGFYVSFTATRWWQQYTAIPWPDKLMNIIALYVPGNDVTSRVLRRTLMRYLNLTLVLVLRSISIPVKRRFPTKEHLVEAGFMSRPELEMYSSVPSHEFNTFWIPCTWFVNLLREAKSECRITDSGGIKLIMEEFNEFRSKCGLLWSYDWVSIPLVYTQVVTLSTQAFFLASLLGRQHINPPKEPEMKNHAYGEYYIPIFTLLQFILYMGMLKLGEQLINPFGDDDEDFELNWIIDRHLKVSFLGVDILNCDPPPLIKDNYFDEMDIKLPYTEAAVAHKVKTYRGSVAAFHVPTEKHGLVIPEFEDENGDNDEDDASTIQSNKLEANRSNAWSLFGYKRKLSSSLDSFNSETMVETGREHEMEIPQLTSNSSWPTFLRSEAELGPEEKEAAWKAGGIHMRDIEQPEGTQGIRWGSNAAEKESDRLQAENIARPSASEGEHFSRGKSTAGKASQIFKQSSFSTSDSSIVMPSSDDPDRRSSANSGSKFIIFDKSPLQVFSKEFSNIPLSVLRDLDSGKGADRSSLCSQTSSSRTREKSVKPNKSMIKCQRSVDPKLRIRPFRSKVTFSEDTKAGSDTPKMMRDQSNRSCVFTKWDSSSDSVASILKTNDEVFSLKRHKFGFSKPEISTTQQSSMLKVSDISFSDHSKRRQSLDPTLYNKPAKALEQLAHDNWLHYQSLPNIQEEEASGPASPTETNSTSERRSPTSSEPGNKALNNNNNNNNNPKTNDQAKLLKPDEKSAEIKTSPAARRRSIKRQRSQEITDEDLAARRALVPPIQSSAQTSTSHTDSSIKPSIFTKQASNESESSNLTDNSTTSNQQINKTSPNTTNSSRLPAGILRKRKEDLKPRQASTESDTGSYHTVRSFRAQLETSNSSSVDSFTSAASESNNNSAASNAAGTAGPSSTPLPPDTTRFKDQNYLDVAKHSSLSNENLSNNNNGKQYLPPSYATMQTTLVPKIVFSQSTPSVTSQSSDDQNSPRWDDNKDFSSIDTVIEYSHRLPHSMPTKPSVPSAPPPPLSSQSLRFESSRGVVHVRVHPQQSQDSVIDIDEAGDASTKVSQTES